MSDIIQYDASGRHFVPASREKSLVRRFGDMLTAGGITSVVRSAEDTFGAPYVKAFLASVRGVGEAGVTGSALGALSAAGAIDYDGTPVDFAFGLASTGVGILAAKSEFGQTLRTAGQTAIGIFAFRKTEAWLGVKKHASVHGDDWNDPNEIDVEATIDVGADPIVACAQEM